MRYSLILLLILTGCTWTEPLQYHQSEEQTPKKIYREPIHQFHPEPSKKSRQKIPDIDHPTPYLPRRNIYEA